MRVWIDLANSPDPLMFAPVARALEDAGAEVVVTARDQAQTAELTLERWPEADVIGGESPSSRPAKAATLLRRVRDLRRWARDRGIDVALSLNSYAQIVAAKTLRMPIVTTMDFEYQPINHLGFRLADAILLPEALPADVVARQGARGPKVQRHVGIKESIYLGDFEPDASVLDALGIDREAGPLVVARTPPSRAVYHRMENPLFEQALERIGTQPEVTCIVLPRHREQVDQLESLGIANLRVPNAAVDSRSLLYAADLFLGAGGTMTREAALMGTPTLSLFAGQTPAVDEWLVDEGLIERFDSPEQVAAVSRRPSEPRTPEDLRRDSAEIIDQFVETVEATSKRGRS